MTFDRLSHKKKRLDQRGPLPPALARNLDDWFRVELTYTSNAIEGNTLTRRETAMVVEKGITVGGKLLVEHLEATNHARAYDWVRGRLARSPKKTVEESDVLRIHETILGGIDDANAGRYRSLPVRISGSEVIPPNPRKVPELMDNFAKWLKRSRGLHPAEQAAEAHYKRIRQNKDPIARGAFRDKMKGWLGMLADSGCLLEAGRT